ncbi:hypothetical protein [Brachybacterium subflavum]|uniref:hypothetical protein n=1 Tax=Brachybacterium subflavum TaxID=2585206 RepID=UPI00126635D2|nr:hypothetical protein [Brachybacterium subflavum]
MKRTLLTLAVPVLAALMLAGCGGTEDAAKPAQTQQSDAGGVSDGGDDLADTNGVTDEEPSVQAGVSEEDCDPELWDEIEGQCMDPSVADPLKIEGAFGFSEGGATYTLGTPTDLPADLAEIVNGAGGDTDGVKVIPVEIDNTQGTGSETLYGATSVTEGGEQHEWQSLGGYLYDVSEAMGSGLGDPAYDAIWEAHEDAYGEIAPTAKDTQYLVVDDGTDLSGTFTFMEMQGGETGGGAIPVFPKVS